MSGRYRELEREEHGEVQRQDDVYGKYHDGQVQDWTNDAIVREYGVE